MGATQKVRLIFFILRGTGSSVGYNIFWLMHGIHAVNGQH
jgi:hypothetical protein